MLSEVSSRTATEWKANIILLPNALLPRSSSSSFIKDLLLSYLYEIHPPNLYTLNQTLNHMALATVNRTEISSLQKRVLRGILLLRMHCLSQSGSFHRFP